MKFLSIVLCLLSTSAFAQGSRPWEMGFSGGYAVQDHILGVPLKNGESAQLSFGTEFRPKWSVHLGYQWLISEQGSGNMAQFHSIRLIPGYEYWKYRKWKFLAEAGVGYQYAILDNVDHIRQVEFLVGPTWKWNFWETTSLELGMKYVQSFHSFIDTGLRQYQFNAGISYRFGGPAPTPEPAQADADQDGVVDEMDQCSNTPFGVKVDQNGCPLDTDGDLIGDYNDFCPDTKKGTEVDEMGCPKSDIGRGVLDKVEFEKDSPRLSPSAEPELRKIAEHLKKYPNLYFLIEGYASAQDDAADRMAISKARATSVMNVLISFGIPAYKMKAIGYGDQYPLVDSKKQNQKLNERVEIKWQPSL